MKKSLIMLFVLVIMFMPIGIACSQGGSYEIKPISQGFISQQIKNMLIDKKYLKKEFSFYILQITTMNNVTAVAIKPPYREFPNVIIFHYDDTNKKWKRIQEGLCLGIQDEPSKMLDLHTVGLGFDMKPEINAYSPTAMKEFYELANKSKMIIIPYKEFLHSHPLGKENYSIDKTMFFDFAKKLLGNRYEQYPIDECTMYDMPLLKSISLNYKAGTYELVGETNNRQVWKINFSGSKDGIWLDDKRIVVSNKQSNS